MREAGFEPAHPEIRRLKRRGIDQLTDSRDHRNVTVTNIFGFSFSVPLYFLLGFIKILGTNNASITTHTAHTHSRIHIHTHGYFSCAAPPML